MPKNVRWTIYTAIIIAFIIAGFWLTHTYPPERYTHHEAPGALADSVPDAPSEQTAPPQTDSADSPPEDGEPEPEQGEPPEDQPRWVITITGEITQVHVLDAGEREEFIGLRVNFDDKETTGEAPTIASPVLAVAHRNKVEDELGRTPEEGDRVTLDSIGIDRGLQSLAIRNIEFSH